MARSVLFKSSARVYNLRFLFLTNLATLGLLILAAAQPANTYTKGIIAAGIVYLQVMLLIPDGPTSRALGLAGIPSTLVLLALMLSTVFRIATVIKTKGGIWQRFEFLGCCMRAHPPYTPSSILLNRSVARPLVRGESRAIILVRAAVLSCIVLGVPAFGVYLVVVVPLNAQIYTRSSGRSGGDRTPPGNATLVVNLFRDASFGDVSRVYATSWDEAHPDGVNCSVTPLALPKFAGLTEAQVIAAECGLAPFLIVSCLSGPFSCWTTTQVSISIAFPSNTGGVYVWPVQGDISQDVLATSLFVKPGPTSLLPGSHLFGEISWTERQMINGPFVGLSKPYPFSNSSGFNVAVLTLRQRINYATMLIQETVDASALSGVATFGGFWTFLNGIFALLFGANVVYFTLGTFHRSFCGGRRPLSALGVVHVFQRRTLVRRYYEDFPMIHTEGGAPGSDSAGIVAFIRERLVDLEEDPGGPAGIPADIEARAPPFAPHQKDNIQQLFPDRKRTIEKYRWWKSLPDQPTP
ncbi:hypothetical protein DFH09DRAFT_1098629 [Mycena vulgaris]|nr:hypothetical protein DFH09DRAFT_1098629 [Mycena vulgaris]